MDNLNFKINALAQKICEIRRVVHKYPETAWTEYFATALVAEYLEKLDFKVTLGAEVIDNKLRTSIPSEQECVKHRQRAINNGANAVLVEKMGQGLTGLWADITFGNVQGDYPILALRFDLDALNIQECTKAEHFPHKTGFSSQNDGVMHACGHDAHVGMGLGVAQILHDLKQEDSNNQLKGRIRLIFQPAEEGAKGAKALLQAGVMNNVNKIIGLHVGISATNPHMLICASLNFLATSNFEVTFKGKAAHAGMAPQEGQNALLAATTAINNIYAISRHGQGQSRVNIGSMICTGEPNIIPAKAWFEGETRGINDDIDMWVLDEVKRIIHAAAHMWQCTYDFKLINSCISGSSDMDLAQNIAEIAKQMPVFEDIVLSKDFFASEDFTWFLKNVHDRGGKGTYIQLGVERKANHHCQDFDFDEGALLRGTELLCRICMQELQK